jgi:hypothetical protein
MELLIHLIFYTELNGKDAYYLPLPVLLTCFSAYGSVPWKRRLDLTKPPGTGENTEKRHII